MRLQRQGKHDAVFLEHDFIVVCYTRKSGNTFEVIEVYSFFRINSASLRLLLLSIRNMETNVR